MGNKWVGGLGAFFLVVFTCRGAQDEFHIFTDKQDRVISAKIVNVDNQRGLVEVELENHQRMKVNPEVFSESDQAYIRDWNTGKIFMSSFGLQVKVVKEITEAWHKRVGAINQNFEKVVYNCELKNNSQVALKNINVEYCVYWMQEKGVPGGEVQEEKDYSGTFAAGALEPRGVARFSTEPVTLFYQILSGGYVYIGGQSEKQSSKMRGIWVKATMTTESGRTFVHDFCEPSDVMKTREWKPPVKPKSTKDSKKGKKKK